MTRLLLASLTPLPLLAAIVALPRSAPGPVDGGIAGTVSFERRAPRLVADEYATGGAHAIPPVPAVVFLEGRVPGTQARLTEDPVMVQADTTFDPALLVIPVGTTVRFPNGDPFFHNVFSYSAAKRFDLGRYPRGESRTVTFDEPGLVKVFCEVHNWMRAAIVVVENPYFALVDDEGGFRIDGVPPGRYRLSAWEFDKRKKSVDVVVREGGTARVSLEL